MKAIHLTALVAVLLACTFAAFPCTAEARESCRSSKGGSTSAALGEEFPEFVRWLCLAAALGEEFPEFIFVPIQPSDALGEEFPEAPCPPKTEDLGEEFPE
jgi:hypothetical protein